MNYFEQIDDYKNGQLSEEALRDFERALKSDSDLLHAVENYHIGQELSEALLELDMHETLAELEESEQSAAKVVENKSSSNPRSISMWRQWLVAASIVVYLAIGGYFIFQGNGTLTKDELMAQHYRPPISDIERGTAPSELPLIDRAKYAFHSKDYEVSEKLFNAVLATTSETDDTREAQYYLGHIMLLQDKYEKATTLFQRSGYDDWKYQLEFVRCLIEPSDCTIKKK